MTRVLVRWVPTMVGATLTAGGVLLLSPVETELVVRIYLLVVGALALMTLIAATSHVAPATPSAFERALVRRPTPEPRPDELTRLERQVALAEENAFDFYVRVRPALVDAAAAALWRRHAVTLSTQPERARELLPPEVWAVVRPDYERPADRHEPGPSIDDLDRVVHAIERMSV